MKNLLIKDHNLSEDEAARFAYPVNKNEKIFSTLESAPKIQRKGSTPDAREAEKQSKKIAASLVSNLQSSDSIQSMANYLGRKGYDKQTFVDEMRRLSQAGLWEPNARQTNELLVSPPLLTPMGDIYFNAFGGE
jgi:hypothetical protein